MPKYSIIVPVYNMEKLLPKCVESIKAQTYSDFEVVLVDDCSTDNSYKMCCEIAAEDGRFKAVRLDKNGGSSEARNAGLKLIKGEYVICIDSDDYLENNLLKELETKMMSGKYDWITWGMYYDVKYPDGTVKIEKSGLNAKENKDVNLPSREDWKTLCIDTFFASPCNKLYRADIIKKNNITFDPACVDFEDLIFNLQYSKYVNSFSILETPFYHYRIPSEQVATLKRRWARTKRFRVSDKVYSACSELMEILFKKGIELDDLMKYAYKAYMNEIEYMYRLGDKKGFVSKVGELTDNSSFYGTLKAMNQRNLQKLIIPLKVLIYTKQRRIFAEIFWLMNKKDIG